MLAVKEVRNPVKTVRAERILAALEAHGPLNDYNAAGAISPEDGVAIVRSKEAALAMTLAAGTVVGATLHIKCLGIGTAGVDTVEVTGTFTGGTVLTFAAKDEHAVLIWVGAAWTPRTGFSAALA